MDDRIRHILEQIKVLEDEIQSELNKKGSRWYYQIQGRRIEFERTIREKHRNVKLGILHWFLTVRPLNYLTAPIIYGLFVPMLLFDFLSCFTNLPASRFMALQKLSVLIISRLIIDTWPT